MKKKSIKYVYEEDEYMAIKAMLSQIDSHVDAQFQSSYAKNELQRLLGELKENILVEEVKWNICGLMNLHTEML